ncbi:Conserved hypothetical, protein [Geosmithia morbida]|uniref:Conserved hypothetical, protein n=1 Tax=Geosmithia morbida TaxID=1094350 RepID=A0A9P4YWX2_9HYPO|nr:Conserved hypothetical, protein [Geosmithia morbida]KAF4123178.1 Conserved hypothetical, protein [Geosmithia morbida]
MSSRSGSSHPRPQRSRDPQDDLPPPTLPPLRGLASQRERDSASPSPLTPSSASSLARLQTQARFWTYAASRRAERIRSLDDADDLAYNEFSRALTDSRDYPNLDPAPPRRAADGSGGSGGSGGGGGGGLSFNRTSSLAHVNSHLRALIDMTSPGGHISPPAITAAPGLSGNDSSSSALPPSTPHHRYQPDLGGGNRRSKRRKIDGSQRPIPRAPPFRYGKYGQVEPGRLRMEMVSCDGGMFSNETSYAAENVLRDDSSVYCTKGNRCNIVLRHQGSTAFTLQELVIKGPTSMNYSHPVREGFVFVAMDHDSLLSRTAQYHIQYAPAPSRREPAWSPDDDDDDTEDSSSRPSVSLRRDGTGGGIVSSSRARRAGLYRGDDDENEEYRAAQMPPEFSLSRPNVDVSTDCGDDEQATSAEADARPLRRPAPNRIGPLPFENMDSEDDDDGDGDGDGDGDDGYRYNTDGSHHADHYNQMLGGGRPSAYSSATPGAGSISLNDAWEAHATATQEAIRAVGGSQLLSPHARFLIEKRKSVCTIRFDPPVTGRFILLKMWNSHHDPRSNIDIQAVVAKGFSGPRFFPSIQLR